MATVDGVNSALWLSASTFNREFAEFFSKRLQADFEVPEQLVACRNLDEVYGVYFGFLQEVFHDYHEEANRLAELARVTAGTAIEVLEGKVVDPNSIDQLAEVALPHSHFED